MGAIQLSFERLEVFPISRAPQLHAVEQSSQPLGIEGRDVDLALLHAILPCPALRTSGIQGPLTHGGKSSAQDPGAEDPGHLRSVSVRVTDDDEADLATAVRSSPAARTAATPEGIQPGAAGRRRAPPVAPPAPADRVLNPWRRASGWAIVSVMPQEKGRAFLRQLLERATEPAGVYRHVWWPGDLVMWDKRCALHRGRSWDGTRCRGVMHRTTVAGDGPTVLD